MAFYYVNKNEQSTGEHEVHQDGCKHLHEYENRKILGSFSNCSEPLKEAKKHYCNVECVFIVVQSVIKNNFQQRITKY